MFLQIAIGAIGVGVILMVGYLVIAQVRSQFNLLNLNDTNLTNSIQNSQSTIFAGFSLLAVGIIVVAAFGLINIFK